MRIRIIPSVFAGMIAGLVIAAAAWGEPTATLSGRVTDAAGAVLAAAKVEAQSLETNAVYSSQTNSLGLYSIPNLPPGLYRLVVRKPGSKTIVKPGVELHVQDNLTLNFAMQAGSLIESVMAPEGAPLLSTENAVLGMTISQRTITELPSLTRNPYDFVTLAAGAAPAGVTRGIGVAVNGQRPESGNMLLDGSDNNNAFSTGPGQTVPLDAVREYRLQTNNFTAEYGRNAGFIANVVTRNGTNEWHGTAYEYIRHSALASNTFQNNALGLPKPSFGRNQFGGGISGPLAGDRLFFFADVEPILVRSSNAVKFYTPTPQLLAVSAPSMRGIFSRYPLATGLSSTDVHIRRVCPYLSVCDSSTRSGFVNVPAFAAVSRTGPIDAGAGAPQNTWLWTARADYRIGPKSTLTARYAFQNAHQFPVVTQPYSADLDRGAFTRNQNATLTLDRSWTLNTASQSRFVFNRVGQTLPQAPVGGMLYFIVLGEGAPLPSGTNGEGGPQNAFQFFQTVSQTRGRHNFRYGAGYFHLRDNRTPSETPATQDQRGVFNNVQAFVDGMLSSFQISLDPAGASNNLIRPPFSPSSTRRHYRSSDYSFFFQDTWKLTPRLSASPGLRYEFFGEPHSAASERSLDANFYYGAGSNIFERIANGTLLRTVDAPGKYKNRFYASGHGNLAPRMGLAYDIGGRGRTVLRAGGGIFYDRLPGIGEIALNPPAYDLTRLLNVALTPALLADAYSVFGGRPVPVTSTVIFHKNQDLKTSYTGVWNGGLEHQLGAGLIVAAAYAGSSGNRLYQQMNDNRQGSGALVGRADTRLFQNASSFATLSNLGHSSYHALQLRIDGRNLANLGLQFGGAYTWSHSIDNVSSLAGDDRTVGLSSYLLDPFNPALDKGASDHDMRQRYTAYFIWEPPALKRSFLLRQWEFSGTVSIQTGQPFSLTDSDVPGRDEVDNTRPRVTGTLPRELRGGAMIADAATPNAFLILPLNTIRYSDGSCNPEGTPFACQLGINGPYTGTIGRNNYSRPGSYFTNVAMMRNFNLGERARLQLRAEFYDVMNHANLYVNVNSRNAARATFNTTAGSRPGVTASFGSPDRLPPEARQVVAAVRLTF